MSVMTRPTVEAAFLSIEEEIKHLLDMFEFYLVERSFGKPVETLGETVASLRTILGRLVADHFLKLDAEREPHFCATLSAMLSERAATLPSSDTDRSHVDYVIEEILTAFEWAQEIKAEFPHDPVMQRIVSFDVPILRPFDYDLRSRLRLVPSNGS